ncbi:hypothetical protein H5410_005224 [Solanum commersonii]|uniref:Uncharacterized protein n=1 Tax=Solanum commersonii TaxID=4109 RepID=A0A9J6A5T9_SOLCO|nr:hypothetical protein H5410_005224 [Solanum commersonii]
MHYVLLCEILVLRVIRDIVLELEDLKSFNSKKLEDHKKGVPHCEGCYLYREKTHAARYCPSLSKLSSMAAAQRKQEKVAMQIDEPFREQSGQVGGVDKGKNVVVGLFNHISLFNHMALATLAD